MKNTAFPQRYLRKVSIAVLAVAIPLSIIFLMIEIGLRITGFRSPIIHAEMFEMTDDPLLPYILRKGYIGDFAGGAVNVGADGYRIVPLPGGAEENLLAREVVVLGDSVAFGLGVDDKDTIAAYLQRHLLWEKKPIRVVSIAAPGYSSWNEYAALLRYRNLSKIQTVVLLYVNNDVTKDNDHFKLKENGRRIYYIKDDPIHRLIRELYSNSRLIDVVADSIKKLNYKSQVAQSDAAGEIDSNSLSYSMEAIKRIRDLCAQRNIQLVVAVYRDGTGYYQPNWESAYERAILSRLEALGVRSFVLNWATDRLSKDQFVLSWNDDSHPSVEASRIIAEQIAAALKTRQETAATGGPHVHE
jgi:hypothetical protein